MGALAPVVRCRWGTEELQRFRLAVEAVSARLSETAERLSAAGNVNEAAIFEAHVELAGDPELASG